VTAGAREVAAALVGHGLQDVCGQAAHMTPCLHSPNPVSSAPACCCVCPQVPSDDPLLVHWVKEPSPFIGLPPPNMNLTGWRDPFVVERPCETNDWEWIVLMGSGG
jgi:hypothetical protein